MLERFQSVSGNSDDILLAVVGFAGAIWLAAVIALPFFEASPENQAKAAIGLVLQSTRTSAQEAVQRAAGLYGLEDHLEEAVADVTRSLEALRAAGVGRPLGANLQLEYPVAGPWNDGQLVSGYIDLVAVEDGRVDVIDFKTDTPPSGPVEQTYPKYVAQVRIYGKVVEAADVLKNHRFRCGLLFTANGAIHWLA